MGAAPELVMMVDSPSSMIAMAKRGAQPWLGERVSSGVKRIGRLAHRSRYVQSRKEMEMGMLMCGSY